MSRKNHPDLHPGDKVKEQKYVAITEAYTILLQASKTSSADISSRSKFNKGSKFSKGSVCSHFSTKNRYINYFLFYYLSFDLKNQKFLEFQKLKSKHR